jgi:MtN3 and saliva related transmembrane protein
MALSASYLLGNSMAILDYAGYAAAVCTTGAYVPQVMRVWRTRSTQDISLKMFLVLVTGLALWLTYGIWRGEMPLIAANSITLILASTILYFKIRHG